MEIAQKNSEYNAQIQVESQKSKSQADDALEDKKNGAKEKQIVLQGYFELMKAGVQVSSDISVLLGEVIKGVAIPLALQNKQMEQQIQQQAMQQEMEQEEMVGQEQMQEQEQLQ